VGGYDARTHESLGDNWPPELGADYRDFTLKFQERTHEVLLKILQALALGLGWEESFFNEVWDISHKANVGAGIGLEHTRLSAFGAYSMYSSLLATLQAV